MAVWHRRPIYCRGAAPDSGRSSSGRAADSVRHRTAVFRLHRIVPGNGDKGFGNGPRVGALVRTSPDGELPSNTLPGHSPTHALPRDTWQVATRLAPCVP